MRFTCPVCYFPDMHEPPQQYNICECCGTEFGLDDEFRSHAELRLEWLTNGAKWFFETPPPHWNPYTQLFRANVPLPWAVQVAQGAYAPSITRVFKTEQEAVCAA